MGNSDILRRQIDQHIERLESSEAETSCALHKPHTDAIVLLLRVGREVVDYLDNRAIKILAVVIGTGGIGTTLKFLWEIFKEASR